MLELRTRLRRLLRQPTYIVSVLVSLGMGTAVSVAAFSFVNAQIFRPLPGIADRRGLIRVDWASGDRRLTTAEFRAMTERRPSAFALLAAQGTTPLPVMLTSGPETLSVAFVSEGFFDTLGTRPVIGRLLGAADADPSAAPVAVMSERFWRRVFNGSSAVVQDSLTIAGRPFPIVGVTPDRFAGLRIVDLGGRDSDYPDVWICLRDASLWPATARLENPWLAVAGRLPPGIPLAAARSELDVIGRHLAGSQAAASVRPRSFRSYRAGLDWRDEPSQSLLTLALFLFVPLSVLGIGCVNVINLQLARAMDESSELSLRFALGASRWRIVRLLLAEVTVVAAIATAFGCAGARVLLLRAGAASPVPLAIDPAAMAFAALLVTGVVGAAGLLPAWWSSRDVVAAGLRELRDASGRRARFRGVLIVIQVAASVALLALSGLATRSLATRAPASPLAREVLTADFDFRSTAADNRGAVFMTTMEERLRDAGAVRGVAFATFTVSPGTMRFGRTSEPARDDTGVFGGYVTPQWFAVTGARFLAGSPRPGFPHGTAVVNRALASILTGGRADTAVGLPIRAGGRTNVEVTGVVDDTHVGGDGRPLPMVFLPMAAATPRVVSLLVLAGDLSGARRAITDAVTALDPTLPLASLQTLDEKTRDLSRGLREMLSVAATLGLLSVALAGAGLHSLLSYAVRRRRREIGIRMALGARSHEVVRLAVAPSLWLVLAGAAAGIAAAVPIAAVIRAVLLGVSPVDPRGLLPSMAILIAVALVSVAGPTLQAIRVDPMDALRED